MNGDNAVRIEVSDGGIPEKIQINTNQGTTDDSITLKSDAGGIKIDALLGLTSPLGGLYSDSSVSNNQIEFVVPSVCHQNLF